MKANVKLILYFSFATAGIAGNVMSSLLPQIRKDISMSYSQSGLLVSQPFIGMLVIGLIGSYAMKKYGNKKFLLAGGILLFLGFLGTIFSNTFSVIFFMNFITVLGFGVYQIGLNTLCAEYSTFKKGNDMNTLHFSYGLGSISSSVLALICINYFGNWRLSYIVALILPLVAMYILMPFKEKEKKSIDKPELSSDEINTNLLKNPFLWILGFTAFVYLGIEGSTSGWIPEFCSKMIKNSIIDPSLATGLFWAAMTFGRLFAGKIADKIGLLKYMLLASIGTTIISFTWFILPPGPLTLISVLAIGLLLSGLYPTFLAFATSSFKGNTGDITSFISVLASLGGILIPIFIGKASDDSGIGVLSICIFAFSVLFTILNIILSLHSKQSQLKEDPLHENNAVRGFQ